jgi:hypothetical protein
MAAVLVVFAFFIGHAVGDFLHAENRLIKLRFAVPIFGQHGDMPNAGKHGRCPPVELIHLKVGRCCQMDKSRGSRQFFRRALILNIWKDRNETTQERQ